MLNEENKQQVNVDFTNFPDLFDGLEIMVKKQGVNRSIFVRNLVKQAWEDFQREEQHKAELLSTVRKIKTVSK